MSHYDYIMVGSGIAGLYTALLARELGSVLILTKGSITECNTQHAQGGIAAAIGPQDSPELHRVDTLQAGAGLCDPGAMRILTEEASNRISELIRLGVPFDTVNGEIALTKEAAHSVSRVLHAGGDATGAHIETTLSAAVRRNGVDILEHHLVTNILVEQGRVQGVKALDCLWGTSREFTCRHLVLATGGAAQLFRFNTNPPVATGDGVALAFNAGAALKDLEFFQFHPTALRLPGAPAFLISEAVRGEGGILLNLAGRRFMTDYTSMAELAPRDVVSRCILAEMQKTGDDHVLLDVTHLPSPVVMTRFPTIYRVCLDYGLDITKSPLPVAPAAHYLMGGIKTNVWGETSLPGLYACGEVACTGVHGANRLASNSLLEVLVFGKRIIQRTRSAPSPSPFNRDETMISVELPQAGVPSAKAGSVQELQRLMWDQVGMVRTRQGLEMAQATLQRWGRAQPEPTDRQTHELANMVTVAQLMTQAALLREESRGAHFRADFPQESPVWQRHIIFVRP